MKLQHNKRRYSILDAQIDARVLLVLYPLLLILGKIVRWTIMRGTLVNMSKGWGWIDPITEGNWSWQFFGLDELTEGDIGQGDNVYTFFKFFWTFLWGRVPESFVGFEICITITFGFFLFLVLAGMKKRLSLIEGAFVCLSVIVMSVYCLCLSKEPFQMFFFLLMYMVLRSRVIPENAKLYAGYLVIFLSVCNFRTYYALIFCFAVTYQILCVKIRKPGRVIRHYNRNGQVSWPMLLMVYLVMVLVYFVMMLALSAVSNDLYLRFRDALLYASDATSGSHTYIENLISINETDPIVPTVTLEYALVVLRLLFPFELVQNGPKYWPYVLYQLFMTMFMFKSLRNMRQNSPTQNAATIIFVGYVFASATFEVDYGAWVRHCAVTIPMVLVSNGIIGEKIRYE